MKTNKTQQKRTSQSSLKQKKSRKAAMSNKALSEAAPIAAFPPDLKEAADFLMRFGYIKQSVVEPAESTIVAGLKRYQVLHGLPTTGKLDDMTLMFIRTPRCGLPDLKEDDYKQVDLLVKGNNQTRFEKSGGKSSKAPFAAAQLGVRATSALLRRLSYRWPRQVNSLTYFIDSITSGLNNTQAHAACKFAFDTWSHVLNPRLIFIETATRNADIVVSWLLADPDPLMNGAIAHSDYPSRFASPRPYGKPVHFDKGRSWTVQLPLGDAHDVQTIALHEIGHLIGFEHAPAESDSVMYDRFQFGRYQHALSMNDISLVRAGYGLP